MKTKKLKIMCIGEALWDNLPKGKRAGGAPMNVALHLKKLGHNVALSSRVGIDILGIELYEFLLKSGLNIENIQSDPYLATSEVNVKLDENNNANYEIVENVAWDNIQLTDALTKTALESDMIVYGTLASRSEVSRNTILSLLNNECTKVIDVNLREPYTNSETIDLLLAKADIIKLNDEELTELASWYEKNGSEKDLMKWIAEKYNAKMIIVTKGTIGSIVYDGDQFFTHSGFKVNTVDTVGAGDSFLAGFLSSWLEHGDSKKAIKYASATGAFVASKEGATPDYCQLEISKILMQ